MSFAAFTTNLWNKFQDISRMMDDSDTNFDSMSSADSQAQLITRQLVAVQCKGASPGHPGWKKYLCQQNFEKSVYYKF